MDVTHTRPEERPDWQRSDKPRVRVKAGSRPCQR